MEQNNFFPITCDSTEGKKHKKLLEKAAQGVAQCEVSATRIVVDAALPRIGKSRLGGHKIANISLNCQRI